MSYLNVFLVILIAFSTNALATTYETPIGRGESKTWLGIEWREGQTQIHAWEISYQEPATVMDVLNLLQAELSPHFIWHMDSSGFVAQLDFFDGQEQHLGSQDFWMSFWHSSDCESWKLYEVFVSSQMVPAGGCVYINADVERERWPGATPSLRRL